MIESVVLLAHDACEKSHANLLEARVVRTLEAQTKTENIATYEEPVAHLPEVHSSA